MYRRRVAWSVRFVTRAFGAKRREILGPTVSLALARPVRVEADKPRGPITRVSAHDMVRPNAYDIAWSVLLAAGAPLWLLLPKPRRKVLRALRERMGRDAAASASGRDHSKPAVMIHAVSLGEINATRALVKRLGEARPDLQFVVSVTTDTGHARGVELYGDDPRVTLIRYPLDFSTALNRVLNGLRPDVVVLMELEVWPNFALHCERRGIPIVLVNGRLTESSFRGYRRARPVVSRMFRRLSAACVQEQAYAERFISLGVPRERVRVTGTMKFDTAEVGSTPPGVPELARAVGLPSDGAEPVWVCGSTGPGEEAMVLAVYRRLLSAGFALRLVIVPRHPERFEAATEEIARAGFNVTRRSGKPGPHALRHDPDVVSVILGDTMGELRKFYSLATVVFVGRTLVDLGPRQHGSDMIEPAALGKPVIVGPFTGNFADVMSRFRGADAMREVTTEEELFHTVSGLLRSPGEAAAIGAQAREVVRTNQGATTRHVEVILSHLNRPHP